MANNYVPRRSASGSHSSSRPSSRSTPSRSRSDSYRSPSSVDRFPRESRSVGDYSRSTYTRRPSQNRRRRKSGPPMLPILVLLVLIIAIVVVIVFAVKGCSSQEPAQGENSSSQVTSAQSGVDSASGDTGSQVTSDTASPSPSPENSPTPAPQEEPSAAPETSGSLLIVGDTAYEYYNFKEDTANQYITAVADAGTKLSGTSTVYDMIIPTSIDIDLPESYIEKYQLNTSDQRKAIEDYIYPSVEAMNSSVKTVSIFDTLKSHANEYLYFRTDHHWTQLGAYYAYVEFCKTRGFEPVALDQFDKKEYTGYLGSFYSSSSEAASALGGNPDTVEAYVPKANVTLDVMQDNGEELPNWPLIADADTYSAGNKYLAFCAGDQPYEEITNNDMTDGPSCIVVKESFGNCFIPFLVNHYSKIYVIDYRHYTAGTVTQLAQEKGADDVLCINNISMTRNDGLVEQFQNIF